MLVNITVNNLSSTINLILSGVNSQPSRSIKRFVYIFRTQAKTAQHQTAPPPRDMMRRGGAGLNARGATRLLSASDKRCKG
jgi:hypothetical protein